MKSNQPLLQIITVFLLAFSSVVGAETLKLPEVNQKQDALFMRRIIEFWEEEEYDLVKLQIEEYLVQYPKSPLKDHMLLVLGDLSMQQKDYAKAIEGYEGIQSWDVKEKCYLNYLQALYEVKDYVSLERESKKYLSLENVDDAGFVRANYYFAESLFYQFLNEGNIEVKNLLSKQVVSLYEILKDSEYKNAVLSSLSQMYDLLGDSQKAYNVNLVLAEELPDMREHFLYNAACKALAFDKNKAYELFSKVCQEGNEYVVKAAYNRILLLNHFQKYQEVIDEANGFFELVKAEEYPQIIFLSGKGYFELGEFEKSQNQLMQFVSLNPENSAENKSSLMMLMQIASTQKQIELYNKFFSSFEKNYSNDPELGKGYLAKAMLYKEKNEYDKELDILQEIEKKHPQGSLLEELQYEYIVALYNTEKYEEARRRAILFIEDYPKGSFIKDCYKLLVNTSIFYASQNIEDSSRVSSKLQLAQDLELAFAAVGDHHIVRR
ncbi:MAG TPA: outer membrane protein assembly factor BamD, partial [Chlamydiales bacterium]|nr:outer membrane protein assembly factor BamD [Chlamydiales bacterium]